MGISPKFSAFVEQCKQEAADLGVLPEPATDWQTRCLAAESERDALAAELKAVKARLPRWRKDTSWFAQQQQRNLVGEWGTCSVFYNSYKTGTGMPPWECRLPSKLKPIQPSWTMEAAMLAVTEAIGLPPCEVEGE